VASDEQIRRREFATVRRGYDPDQVRAYLATLADHVEALERALIQARARVKELEAAPPPQATDAYEQLSQRFAGVLATADTEAGQLVEEARTEAERIKAEARARAEEVRVRGSQSLIAAQEESDRMLSSLSERREAMLQQLHDMQSRLLSVADDLEVAIKPATPPEAGRPAEPVPYSVPSERPNQPSPSEAARPVEDLWVSAEPGRSHADAGLAGLFDDPVDEVDLPDLSDLDLGLDDEREPGR